MHSSMSLGEAIKHYRETYGSRVESLNNRTKLSQDKLYDLCVDKTVVDYPDPVSRRGFFNLIHRGGRDRISRWENGKLSPNAGERRILEKVLCLEPHLLDQYLPKAQRHLLDNEARSQPSALLHSSAATDRAAPAPATALPPASKAAAAANRLDWIDRLGCIDPVIEAGVGAPQDKARRFSLPHDADKDDKDITAIVRAMREGNRLTVVTGQPFLGKKAKIKGALRRIAESSDSLTLNFTAPDGSQQKLPILAWSARGLHYRALVQRVHDFLEEYAATRQGHSITSVRSFPMPEKERALDELIEQINLNFTELPAVFIFTDVDAFGANTARNVVRDLGIEQLVRTLLDANRISRILITTTDFEGRSKGNPQFINFPQNQIIRIGEPRFSEIRNFVRSDIRSAQALHPIYDFEARMRGDDLVSFGALVNLTYDTETADLPEQTMAAIKGFVESDDDDRDAARGVIYRQIADAITEHALLHPIALIAASEDGVRPDSMRFLLDRWRMQNETITAFGSDEALNAALASFAGRIGTRFLTQSSIARYDAEEYDFHESHRAGDQVWEIDPIISVYLLDALRTFDRRLPAYAHRLIALMARMRSQQKKVQMRSPIGSRASEEGSRDIQCYVNLLASILYETGSPHMLGGPPLRLSEAQIFAIDDSFSAAKALRFAVFCLLKEDIDRDHRLTMIFDEDALRLDLFLLLFQDLGRVYAPEFDSLDLPDELPDHLTGGLFSEVEILDLLSTIALSAFHAQRSDVVDKVVELATDFAERHSIAPSSVYLSRIWCCKIDASIRRGRLSERALGADADGARKADEHAPGYLAIYEFVRERRHKWYPDLAGPSRGEDIADNDLNRHKAHLRLLIREADLAALVAPNRTVSSALYARVEELEAMLASRHGLHEPVVLSGRAGRRYIRFLLDGLEENGETPRSSAARDAVFAKVEALLSVNKSRLRRFSGADRVGVMLDMARLKRARGDLAGANHFAESAKRRAFSGSVSHGGKLDVFQVMAETKLSLVERDDERLFPAGQNARQLLRDAEIAVRNLAAVAQNLSYDPSLAVGYMLEARLALVRHNRRRSSAGVGREEELQKARESLRKARACLDAIQQVDLDSKLASIERAIKASP